MLVSILFWIGFVIFISAVVIYKDYIRRFFKQMPFVFEILSIFSITISLILFMIGCFYNINPHIFRISALVSVSLVLLGLAFSFVLRKKD